tara:strand:+ start:2034 stop:2261 length:228 start_codon:yes stop_codon:yes gene_type:complete
MRELTSTLYGAIRAHYEGERTKALYQLDLAFQKPVAIGEHPKIVEDSIALVKQLAEAEEALQTLENNFGAYNDRS